MASSPDSNIPVQLILSLCVLIFSGLLYLARWFRRQHTEQKARCWPSVEAVIHNSFELSENNNPGNMDSSADYVFLWITAIEYSYQVQGEFYAGTYFLPHSYNDSGAATDAGKAWLGKKISIRYDPAHPEKSVFLEKDGAPGKSRIPVRAERPYVTTLSLK